MTLNTPVGVGWPGTPVDTRQCAIAWPAILLNVAELAGRRRMAWDAGRYTRMRDRMSVGIECELLLGDRDDNGEHAFRSGGHILAFLGLGRRLVARCQHRGFGSGGTHGVGLRGS